MKQRPQMEGLVAQAFATAWSIHLTHNESVDSGDAKRCNLERFLTLRAQAVEITHEELAVEGLAYLRRFHRADGEST